MGLSVQQNRPPDGGVRFAPWYLRCVSGVIDALLVGVVFGLWLIVVRSSPAWLGPQPEDLGSGLGYAEAVEARRDITRWLVAGMLSSTAVVALVNSVVIQGIKGRTLGKLLTGQRLIDAGTGRRVGVGRALLRQLAHIADALPCYLGFFWPIFDERRRTFADIAARTVVITTKPGHGPAPVVGQPPPANAAIADTGMPAVAPIAAPPGPTLAPRPPEGPGRSGTGAEFAAPVQEPGAPSAATRRKYLIGFAAAALVSVTLAGVAIVRSVDTSASEVSTEALAPPKALELGGVEAVALSPDGRSAYVSESPAPRTSTATVAVVDTATTTLEARIEVEAGAGLHALTVSPDGTRLYGVAWGALLVIDTTSRRLVDAVEMSTGSRAPVSRPDGSGANRVENLDVSVSFDELAVSGDGRRIYASGGGADRIWMYDSVTRKGTAAPIPGPDSAVNEMTLSDDNRRLYVGALLEDQELTRAIVVLDALTMAETGRYPADTGGVLSLSNVPDNGYLYWAAGSTYIDVVRIDTRTGAAAAPFRLQTNALGLAQSESGRYLFIAHDRAGQDTNLGQITVLDAQSGEVVERIDIDFAPARLVPAPDGRHLYVGSGSDGPHTRTGWFASVGIGAYR